MAVVIRKSDHQKFEVFGFWVLATEAVFYIWDDGWQVVSTEDFEPAEEDKDA